MQSKLKLCYGCSLQRYIYKNINGEKYCKPCAMKLVPPPPIRKITPKQVFKIELKKKLIEEDKEFYLSIWNTRNHICSECKKYLGEEPFTYHFDHILEKELYPNLRHESANIQLLCLECHDRKTKGLYSQRQVMIREILKSLFN